MSRIIFSKYKLDATGVMMMIGGDLVSRFTAANEILRCLALNRKATIINKGMQIQLRDGPQLMIRDYDEADITCEDAKDFRFLRQVVVAFEQLLYQRTKTFKVIETLRNENKNENKLDYYYITICLMAALGFGVNQIRTALDKVTQRKHTEDDLLAALELYMTGDMSRNEALALAA